MTIFKPMKRSVAIVTLLVLVLIGGGYAAWSYYDAPPLTRYAPVLALLADNKLEPTGGAVDLTTQFPGLTPKNVVYVTRRDDGSFLAMFPTYYGEGAEVAGLLYTSRPLLDEDVHHRVGTTHFDQVLIDVGSYGNLLLEKRISPNWYHVSYKLR